MGHKTTKKATVKEVPPSPDTSSDELDSAVGSSDEEPYQHHIAYSKKTSPAKITKLPSPSSDPQSTSDDDEQSDDDDEVEDNRTRTPSPPPQPKPTTKPNPKPTPSKRPADSQPTAIVAALPEKKHKSSSSSAVNSKGMFEKIWSADDEALILNAILEFTTSKGSFGSANHGDLLDSIRDSLSVPGFTKVQLTNKIRRLRDRYRCLRFKPSGRKPNFGPNDGLVLKVGDLLWRGSDKSRSVDEDENLTKRDKKGKGKGEGKGVVEEANGVAKEGIVEEARKAQSCNGGVGREQETDSDDGVELDVEYMRINNKIIRHAMKKMSEEERNEVNEKLRKANAGFKAAYCLKLEVLLMTFKKHVG